MTVQIDLKKIPKVGLHPHSLKYLKLGHPWITSDRFSDRFPRNDIFLCAVDEQNKDLAVLIHDPSHPKIKARLWSAPSSADFFLQVEERIKEALNRRSKILRQERDNFYLIFAEADQLPGVLVQKLGRLLFVQFTAFFWKKWEREFLQILRKVASQHLVGPLELRVQYRKDENFKAAPEQQMVLSEWGVRYQLKLGAGVDFGLYTDMSALRYQVGEKLGQAKKVLNLYAYTGAYSLFALSRGAGSVVSVDLSQKNIDWLEENLKLNPELPAQQHQSLTMSSEEALEKFIKKGETFDFIISDPPSVFSEGNKSTQALSYYPKLLSLLLEVCSPGGYMLVFLNTHTVGIRAFEEKIQQVLREKKNAKVVGHYQLGDDCPRLKGFPEGDYLKGLLLQKR